VTTSALQDRVGCVVIGRNEGVRLKACLQSLQGAGPVVYVDSGSTDGSQDFARSLGIAVIDLAVPPKFTAARARNAGMTALLAQAPTIDRIQMVDGDCVVEPGWLDTASAALDANPALGGVFGRRAEISPDHSIYNRLCDIEWNVPVGPVDATGGDAMFRVAALQQVSGYDPSLIAGEEPDMCLRMGRHGWRFLRIDAPMTRHDANMGRFGQWWRRANRAGYAAASHVARHGTGALPGNRAQVRRMLLWGAIFPAVILLMLALALADGRFAIAALLGIALYPLQWLRLARAERRHCSNARQTLQIGGLRLLHQFAALSGLIDYRWDRLRGRERGIIEYR
jgi:glycosyltransferase involved in cell wall biosynthesis